MSKSQRINENLYIFRTCRNFSLLSKRLFVSLLVQLLVLNCSANLDPSDLIVELPNGKLLGIEQASHFSGKPFIEFRGVPYAFPPKGNLRFKAPEEYNLKWEEPYRDATTYGSMCPQDDVLNEPPEEGHIEEIVQPIGDEDCLFINVATPWRKSIDKDKKYPVLVWVHGGSFLYEYGHAYAPHKLLEHEVIVVTFNYRLGALGFITTEGENDSDVIGGNNGLKDQSLALRWIRNNIGLFGGDANSVTIMGVNAGAASVHLHLLSPMSKGLFHRAILMSGTGISPWALQRDPRKVTKGFLSWIDCREDKAKPLNETVNLGSVPCLRSLSVDTIIRKQARLTEWFIDPLVPLGPSIEVKGQGQGQKFLTDDPYTILQSGDYWGRHQNVELVIGVNSHEGLLHSWDIAHHPMLFRTLNMEWQRAAPITLMFKDTGLNYRKISEAVFNHYFSDTEDSENDDPEEDKGKPPKKLKMVAENFYKFGELTQMYSDRYFFIPAQKAAELHFYSDVNPNANVYLYWFDYKGRQSSTQFSGYNDTVIGAAHYDQIQYLFRTSYFKDPEAEEDIQFGKNFIEMITQYVKDGSPFSPGWIPLSKSLGKDGPFVYNKIRSSDSDKALGLINPFEKNLKFWDTLPILEYGRKREEFNDDSPTSDKPTDDNPNPNNANEELPGLDGLTKEDIKKLIEKLEL